MSFDLPNGWKKVKLGEVLNFRRGHDLPKKQMVHGKFPVVASNGIIGYHDEFTTINPCVTIGRSGNTGTPYYYNCDCWAHNTTLYIDNFRGNYPKYLFYLLKTLNLDNYKGGSAVPTLNRNHIHPIEIIYTDNYREQHAIAATLSCLDDKIELNNRINKKLEEMAQAIFKSWFVDFEPFKDDEFVESELGLIPKGWRVGTLGEIIELHDSKRIPLSSRERGNMQKLYPYYGAASLMDYVDNYIFDGTYVLLGEDGTVVTDTGHPILQYVWGKFWVNNHAHIMKATNGFSEESLYVLLANINIQGAVTGAVQLKVNQANLKAIKVTIPNLRILIQYNKILLPLFNEKRKIYNQNQALADIRDTLLPKLMSGKIRIPIKEETFHA